MLRTLIVDDEAPARQRLRHLLAPMAEGGRVDVVGEAADGVEALERLRAPDAPAIDLLLLDIRMPEMSGFDLLGQLPAGERPDVIFTTAYDRYALRAFEANAVDYLLKPIKRERLEESIARVERLRQSQPHLSRKRLKKLLDWVDTQHAEEAQREEATQPAPGAAPAETPAINGEYARQISVSFRDRIRLIPTEQVVAIEIHEGITRLFVDEDDPPSDEDGLRQHVIDYTLDTLEDSLDPAEFMRVHRSSIVRLDRIEEMVPWRSGRYKLILTSGHEVIASRDRSRQLRDRLMI